MKRFIVLLFLMLALGGVVGCSKQEAENALETNNSQENEAWVSVAPTRVPTVIPKVSPPIEEAKEELIILTNLSDLLCADNEEVLFGFPIKGSKKWLAICIAKDNQEYIVYRFGTKAKVELEFPDTKAASWSEFIYSYYLRGGGADNVGLDLNYLTFENNGFRYKIYEEYSAENNENMVGVLVTELVTGKETKIEGVYEEAVGSLINLRDNDKISKESE